MKKTIKYIIVFFLVTVFSACQDLLIETPEDRFVLDNFYSSETDAQASVDAVYNRIGAGYYERIFFLVADLPADDYKNGGGMSNSFLQDIEYYRHTSENEFIKRVWRESYDGIARANTALIRIPDVIMDQDFKNRLLAEASFIRALLYFNLVRLFGEVPLVTKIESIEDALALRSPVADVYNLIIDDLEFAESMLPVSYPGKEAGRATKGAAIVLLGKVYLTMGNMQDAETVLAEIVNNEGAYGYGLHDNFRANWEKATEHGMETVFTINFSEPPGNGNQMMQGVAPKYSVPGGKVPGLAGAWEADIPTQEVYNLFEDVDERKDATFRTDFISPTDGNTYTSSIPLFFKYYEEGEKICRNSDNNVQVLRYADVLLMYAEALNENGKTGVAEPILNRIRERAFNDTDHNYSGLGQAALRDAIYDERRLELVHEGHRWFDLVRTGRLIQRMKDHAAIEAGLAESDKVNIASNIKDYHVLMPIPQHEIDLNSELGQNQGY